MIPNKSPKRNISVNNSMSTEAYRIQICPKSVILYCDIWVFKFFDISSEKPKFLWAPPDLVHGYLQLTSDMLDSFPIFNLTFGYITGINREKNTNLTEEEKVRVGAPKESNAPHSSWVGSGLRITADPGRS